MIEAEGTNFDDFPITGEDDFVAMIHIVDEDAVETDEVEDGDEFAPGTFDVLPNADAEDGFVAGGVTDDATVTVVDPAESELDNLDIAGQDGDATIAEGDDEDVSVNVDNVGDVEGDFDVTLFINTSDDGTTVYEETVEGFTVAGDTAEDLTFDEVTAELGADEYDVEVSTEDDSVEGDLTVEEPDQQPAVADTSNIDPDAVEEGDEDDYTATVDLEDAGDVTEGDVTVELVNYEDGDETSITEEVTEADLSGDNPSVTVEEGDFDGVTAPDAAEYDVQVTITNFDGDVSDIENEQIDQIDVTN